jgi:hypothetical protein
MQRRRGEYEMESLDGSISRVEELVRDKYGNGYLSGVDGKYLVDTCPTAH